MRAGEVNSGTARLSKAAERLETVWRETQQHWNDKNSRSFEQEELQPLFLAVRTVVEATRRYTDVVQHAKMACDSDARERYDG